MLEFFKSQLWWILQIVGSLGVFVALAYARVKGFNWNSYLVYILISISICSWIFLKSYEIAPSFFQAWFVGTTSMVLLGFLGSLFYFGETVSIINYIGAGFGILASVMLIL